VASASPADVRLFGKTLDARCVEEVPERLIGDEAYFSAAITQELGATGTELIAPNRRNRTVKSPDGLPFHRHVLDERLSDCSRGSRTSANSSAAWSMTSSPSWA